MKAKLTKALVESTQPDPERDVLIWDTKTMGLGVRVARGGTKSFVFQYRAEGRDRRITLGRYRTQYTLTEARKLASNRRM